MWGPIEVKEVLTLCVCSMQYIKSITCQRMPVLLAFIVCVMRNYTKCRNTFILKTIFLVNFLMCWSLHCQDISRLGHGFLYFSSLGVSMKFDCCFNYEEWHLSQICTLSFPKNTAHKVSRRPLLQWEPCILSRRDLVVTTTFRSSLLFCNSTMATLS